MTVGLFGGVLVKMKSCDYIQRVLEFVSVPISVFVHCPSLNLREFRMCCYSKSPVFFFSSQCSFNYKNNFIYDLHK